MAGLHADQHDHRPHHVEPVSEGLARDRKASGDKEDAMKRVGSMLFLFGALLFTGCGKKVVSCDEETSRLVAKAYFLSAPLIGRENELIPLIQSNPDDFNEGGRAIRCMQSLGTALTQGGLEQSKQLSGPSATEQLGHLMPIGLEHLPGQVDASLRSYGSDMFNMGNELVWLSQVLPPAVQGNYTPYNTTGTSSRRMAAQALQNYRMLCQMNPGACRMMQAMFLEMEPMLEQEIYSYALQLGD
jgi:hypothetical protein